MRVTVVRAAALLGAVRAAVPFPGAAGGVATGLGTAGRSGAGAGEAALDDELGAAP
jgi:hypothetical protein